MVQPPRTLGIDPTTALLSHFVCEEVTHPIQLGAERNRELSFTGPLHDAFWQHLPQRLPVDVLGRVPPQAEVLWHGECELNELSSAHWSSQLDPAHSGLTIGLIHGVSQIRGIEIAQELVVTD